MCDLFGSCLSFIIIIQFCASIISSQEKPPSNTTKCTKLSLFTVAVASRWSGMLLVRDYLLPAFLLGLVSSRFPVKAPPMPFPTVFTPENKPLPTDKNPSAAPVTAVPTPCPTPAPTEFRPWEIPVPIFLTSPCATPCPTPFPIRSTPPVTITIHVKENKASAKTSCPSLLRTN